MPKTISIYGRPFIVDGGEGDNYFQALTDGTDLADPVLEALKPHVGPDAVCIDAGANIGLYTLALSSLAVDGRVYAFEPSPSAFCHLEENVRANRLTNVEASPRALGDHAGTVRFHDFPFFSAGSFTADETSMLTSEAYRSTVSEVPVTTLDSVVEEHGLPRVDFLKIDVEGAELSVLEGAAGVLAAHRPAVVMEFNSFAFATHHGVLPQVALARIRQIFPYVYVLGRIDGELARLETGREEYDFLYDNGIHGPTDNFLCTFSDLGVTRRYERVGPPPPPPPNVEVEAMRRTVSWRITRPVRWTRMRLDAALASAPVLDRLSRRAGRHRGP